MCLSPDKTTIIILKNNFKLGVCTIYEHVRIKEKITILYFNTLLTYVSTAI